MSTYEHWYTCKSLLNALGRAVEQLTVCLCQASKSTVEVKVQVIQSARKMSCEYLMRWCNSFKLRVSPKCHRDKGTPMLHPPDAAFGLYSTGTFWFAMPFSIKVSQTPVCSLVRSVPSLRCEIHVLQATNVAEAWQRGYESVHFLRVPRKNQRTKKLTQWCWNRRTKWPCL